MCVPGAWCVYVACVCSSHESDIFIPVDIRADDSWKKKALRSLNYTTQRYSITWVSFCFRGFLLSGKKVMSDHNVEDHHAAHCRMAREIIIIIIWVRCRAAVRTSAESTQRAMQRGYTIGTRETHHYSLLWYITIIRCHFYLYLAGFVVCGTR